MKKYGIFLIDVALEENDSDRRQYNKWYEISQRINIIIKKFNSCYKKWGCVSKKIGVGLKPILEVIDELGKDIRGSIIGDKILGKAS